MKLGVNIDHVATLRQARYSFSLDAPNAEPDLVAAASACERAGAHGITIHLRADRRHIQDRRRRAVAREHQYKLNLEMGNTPAISTSPAHPPEEVCLVPENRAEITTEGGLDAAGQIKLLTPTVTRLQSGRIRVSLFIEPEADHLPPRASWARRWLNCTTGAFANAFGKARDREVDRLRTAAEHAYHLGIQVNAGHGINYQNIALIRKIPTLRN